LRVENGKLLLAVGWQPELPLEPLARDEFGNPRFGVVVFGRVAAQRLSGLEVFEPRVRGLRFDRTP
jgi:hypothetical protein